MNKIFRLLVCFSLASAAPVYYGIFIGNNMGLIHEPELDYATQDAKKMANALAEGGLFQADKIYLLENQNIAAVKEKMLEIKKRIAQTQSKSDAVLVVYFSGHGDQSSLHLNGEELERNDLLSRFKEITANTKILVVDACESGSLIRAKGRIDKDNLEFPHLKIAKGTAILTSSAAGQLSHESAQYRGGIFTYHLIQGLKGIADLDRDNQVSLMEWFNYGQFATRRESLQKYGVYQTPGFDFDLSGLNDIPLAKHRHSSHRLELLRLTASEVKISDLLHPEESATFYLDGRNLTQIFVEPSIYQVEILSNDKALYLQADLRFDTSVKITRSNFNEMPLNKYQLKGKGELGKKPSSVGVAFSMKNSWGEHTPLLNLKFTHNSSYTSKVLFFAEAGHSEKKRTYSRQSYLTLGLGGGYSHSLSTRGPFEFSTDFSAGIDFIKSKIEDLRPFHSTQILQNTWGYYLEVRSGLELGYRLNSPLTLSFLPQISAKWIPRSRESLKPYYSFDFGGGFSVEF